MATASFCSSFAGTNYVLGHRWWHARPDTFAHVPEQLTAQAIRGGQVGLEQMNWQTLELQARTFMPTAQPESLEAGIPPEAIMASSSAAQEPVVSQLPILPDAPDALDAPSESQQTPPASIEASQDFAAVPYIGRMTSALN